MKVLHLVYFMICSATILSAQTMSLSLDDAIKRSLETSKNLSASNQKVRQADAKLSESNANRLPSVKLQGSYTRLSDVGPSQFDNPLVPGQKITLQQAVLDNYQLNLSASQVLFSGFRLDAAKDIAEYSAKAAQLDYANDKLSTSYNTSFVYWSLYKAQELKKSVSESVKQLDARVRDGQNLFKAGMITNNDVLKLQVQLANTKVQLLDIDQQATSIMVSLNNLIGLPLNTALELSTQPATLPQSSLQIGTAIDQAQQQRPDVAATEMRLRAADRGVDVANGAWWPTVSASANYLYANPNSRIFPSHAQFDGTWALGVNFSWDVWNWMLPSHQAAQAQAQMLGLRENVGMLKDGIAVEATQNYMALSPARERVSVADEAVKQAEENNSIIASRYKVGTATATDVIEAETLLLQSKVNKVSAVVDFELAVAKLNRTLGK